jgi:energy-coupling factor transport system permease protein
LKSMDPRTRLILGLFTVALVLCTGKPWLLAAELAALLLGVLLLGMAGPWLKSLRISAPMVAVVFLVGVAAFPLSEALEMALRFQALLTASFLLFSSITPDELGGALRRMGLPYQFSFIIVTAMRYVPLMGRRLRAIMEAQRSRGIDLRPRPGNLGNLTALLAPLLIQSFQLAEDLAMAMEVRGFARKGRTLMGKWRISPWEYGLMALWAAVLALLVGSRAAN